MSKELDELRREYAENEAKLRQYQHRAKRLEQRKQYYEKGERQKRAHRLITRGAAVESVAPEVRPLSEQGFYSLAERIFSMPEVREAVRPPPSGRANKWPCSIWRLRRSSGARDNPPSRQRPTAPGNGFTANTTASTATTPAKAAWLSVQTLLPCPRRPQPKYQDRQTLWNAVENAERGKDAQLAYSFDIALQNEFSLEENIALARQFLLEQFVSRGMVVDFAVHQPDKEDGGIPNPHFHVLCPIRPIREDGKWGFKQRRVYRLDGDGNRILDSKGKPLFDAVPTTDWGRPETLEHWREAWAEMCNAKFEEKGLPCRIDHRSYLRQGLDLLPHRPRGAWR